VNDGSGAVIISYLGGSIHGGAVTQFSQVRISSFSAQAKSRVVAYSIFSCRKKMSAKPHRIWNGLTVRD